MTEALPEETLRRIQEIVAAETGATFAPEAAARLYAALATAFGKAAPALLETDRTCEVTVLLADLRGFTWISEAFPVGTVLELLNRYLARMCEIAVRNGGTIDKFMGDSIMLLFGSPQGGPDDARRAVVCAAQMQIAMHDVNREHAARKLPELFMGIGINTGRVMAGRLGSELHSEYTVIGDEVNLASRLEALNKDYGTRIIVSASTRRAAGPERFAFEAIGEVQVRGRTAPTPVYTLRVR